MACACGAQYATGGTISLAEYKQAKGYMQIGGYMQVRKHSHVEEGYQMKEHVHVGKFMKAE